MSHGALESRSQESAAVAPLNLSLLNYLKKSSHIPALDMVRGIAAWTVVVGHTFGPPALGAMAVSVFFVLSGFLITWLLVQESDFTGKVSLRDFYIRRTLRIFPGFYVFWFICIFAALLRQVAIPWGEALSSFFYMADYYTALHPTHIHQIMGITWSLGIEEKFYLLWPAIFAAFHRNPARLLKIAVGGISVIWMYRIIACLTLSLPSDYLLYAFESRFDNILYGCALALALKLIKIEPLLAVADRIKIFPLLIAGALVELALLGARLGPTFRYVLGMTLTAVLVVLMLIQLVFLGALRRWKWVDHPLLRFFGRISYSLYLYHIVVISAVQHYLPGLSLRFAYPLIYGGSAAVAYTSYRVVEKPFLSLKNRLAVAATRPN